MGDFNIDLLKKTTLQARLLNDLISHGLVQTIFQYTRVQNDSKSCIDNIFTNATEYTAYTYSALISDHEAQIITINIGPHSSGIKNKLKRRYTTRNKENFLSSLFEEDWNIVYEETNPDEKFNRFLDIFKRHYEASFPLKPTTSMSKKVPKPTHEIRQVKETLELMYDIYRQTGTEHMKHICQKYKQYYITLTEEQKKRENLHNIYSADNKQKTLWETINRETDRGRKPTSGQTPSCEDFQKIISNLSADLIQESTSPVATETTAFEVASKWKLYVHVTSHIL